MSLKAERQRLLPLTVGCANSSSEAVVVAAVVVAAVVVAGQSGLRSRIGRCNNRSLAHDRSEPVLNRKPSVPLSAPLKNQSLILIRIRD